jgi:hypothetical protein
MARIHFSFVLTRLDQIIGSTDSQESEAKLNVSVAVSINATCEPDYRDYRLVLRTNHWRPYEALVSGRQISAVPITKEDLI